jgi:hypothetical protein
MITGIESVDTWDLQGEPRAIMRSYWCSKRKGPLILHRRLWCESDHPVLPRSLTWNYRHLPAIVGQVGPDFCAGEYRAAKVALRDLERQQQEIIPQIKAAAAEGAILIDGVTGLVTCRNPGATAVEEVILRAEGKIRSNTCAKYFKTGRALLRLRKAVLASEWQQALQELTFWESPDCAKDFAEGEVESIAALCQSRLVVAQMDEALRAGVVSGPPPCDPASVSCAALEALLRELASSKVRELAVAMSRVCDRVSDDTNDEGP